jgi:hypothetical protein
MWFAREFGAKILSICTMLLMVSGCSKKPANNKAASSKKQAAFSFNTLETNIDVLASTASAETANLELEAKLIDIPTMVGSVMLENDSDQILAEGQLMFACVASQEQSAISDFYNLEMEQLGWQRVAAIQGNEIVLLYQKPKKVCIISIRPLSHRNTDYQSLIHIATSSKEK